MAKTKPCWAKVTGPLAEYAPGFRDELFRLGYTPLTAACQLRLAAHLSRWMTAEELGTQDLDMPAAERYFAARRSAGYANERTVEALGPLLGYLRRLGAGPAPGGGTGDGGKPAAGPVRGLPDVERGLAPGTVTLNVRLARPFLQQRTLERDGRLDLEQLTAAEVRAFVLDQARKQPRSAKRIVTALRSLLRFLHVDGVLAAPAGGRGAVAGRACAGRASPRTGARAGRRRCWPPATRLSRPDAGTGRSFCCCPGWACGPARSRDSAWTTSTGGAARSPSAARAGAGTGCRCPPTWARRSSPTCATGARPARWTARCSSPPRHPGKHCPIPGSPRSSRRPLPGQGSPGRSTPTACGTRRLPRCCAAAGR